MVYKNNPPIIYCRKNGKVGGKNKEVLQIINIYCEAGLIPAIIQPVLVDVPWKNEIRAQKRITEVSACRRTSQSMESWKGPFISFWTKTGRVDEKSNEV